MSEQDRGAYTPQSDAPLTFDARQAESGGGPAPMTLLASAIVLLAMIVALLMFYRHGARHTGQPPVLVGAPVGQTKSPPPPATESSDQAAGLQVYKDEATPSSEASPSPSFEQAPEQPAPLPAARPTTPPPPLLSAAPLSGPGSAPAAHRPHPPKPAPAAVASPQPAPHVATKPPETDNMVANNAFSSTAAPSHAVAPPHPANVAPAKPAPAPAATKAASAAKPKPPEPTPTPAASSGGGKAMVQIGAFSSAALAQQGWTDTAHLLPGQMAGKSRGVEETSKGGKTFYRAYVGGFASKAEAADFCAALKAKAKPCFVK